MPRTVLDVNKMDVLKHEAGITTDKELADRADMSTTTLVSLRKGRPFDSKTLDRLASVLQCNPLDLITVAEGEKELFSPAPAARLPLSIPLSQW